MKILGIDPGLSTTGYGVIQIDRQETKCLTHGVVSASSGSDLSVKLLKIFKGIESVISRYDPEYCAVENIFYHLNKKTAIVMGHARAAAMLSAAKNNIPVFEYSPREIKMSIVGNGNASKEQIQAMVKNLLNLSSIPVPNDAADALAVALCHHHREKFKRLLENSNKQNSPT